VRCFVRLAGGVEMPESELHARAARLIQSRHERALSPHQLQTLAEMEVEKWRNWSQLAAGCRRYWP